MTINQKIGDLVEVPPVQTVIRLEDGRERPNEIASSFIFTPEIDTHFAVLAEALSMNHGRGYFLQGDFGSGKSHFLCALEAWLRRAPGTDVLTSRHAALQQLHDTGRRFLPVAVSLVRFRASTSLEQILVQAIEAALQEAGSNTRLTPLSIFNTHLLEILGERSIAEKFSLAIKGKAAPQKAELANWVRVNPREAYSAGVRVLKDLGLPLPQVMVEDRHETFGRVMSEVRDAGFDGLFILLDELSEFFRSKPDARQLNEDARTMQFLGELAASEPLWIIGAVQESIERTGDIAPATFRKIKDRYPVKFALSTVHIRDLIARRLVIHKSGSDRTIRDIYDRFRKHFPDFKSGFAEFRDIYPVHPVTLSLLEGLGDLFSEHRGIVDFIHTQVAGDPQRNAEGIMDRPCVELLAPDSIYRHFAPRLREFSAFNIYPRHVIPHLDQLIDEVVEDHEDRELARRLVRILVLYRIHPTAGTPTARMLTELGACMLAEQDPDLGIEFVTQAILDPLARASGFIRRNAGADNDPGQVTYEIITEDDPAKNLRARIERTRSGIDENDTRKLMVVFDGLEASTSWPGSDIMRQAVTRNIQWRQSTRQAMVRFCPMGERETVISEIVEHLDSGSADFGLIISIDDISPLPDGIALWRMGKPEDPKGILCEHLAARMVTQELKPGNPADAPLLDPAMDTVERLKPMSRSIALSALYDGTFSGVDARVDPAARQMQRFDRILETIGHRLLEKRYPRFSLVAPRDIVPAPRLLQHLLDRVIAPGKISLQAARQEHLTQAIEGIAIPLGLVELKSGSYVFAPDLRDNPLLAFFMGLLDPANPMPLDMVTGRLGASDFGLPRDLCAFLTIALAHGGVISLLSRGRTMPLEMLHLGTLQHAEAIAVGELICEADRRTLVDECLFLHQGRPWDSFGLRQQREAWQTAVQFKRKFAASLDELLTRLRQSADFTAFARFDLESVTSKAERCLAFVNEIKTSYPPREGLERLVCAWRESGLDPDDTELLQQMHAFFASRAEQYLFINHYLAHAAVARACEQNPRLNLLYESLANMLGEPGIALTTEGCKNLERDFTAFRESYLQHYTAGHDKFHCSPKGPQLTRQMQRSMEVLRRLAAIDLLDRPPGMEQLFTMLSRPSQPTCKRNVREQLLRGPVCECGFIPGDQPPGKQTADDPGRLISQCLEGYSRILREPQIAEALAARAYALKDADPAAAERVENLRSRLNAEEQATATTMLDALDQGTVQELSRSLTGRVQVEHRDSGILLEELNGRRLQPEQVMNLVRKWLGRVSESTVIAVDMRNSMVAAEPVPATSTQQERPDMLGWWPLLHPELHACIPETSCDTGELARSLQRQYPATSMTTAFGHMSNEELVRFLMEERLHHQALREAWQILAERVIDEREKLGQDLRLSDNFEHEITAEVAQRIRLLQRQEHHRANDFPERLRARLPLVALFQDLWGNDRIQSRIMSIVNELEAHADDWLATLQEQSPIDRSKNPVIVVLDAVGPDVWLDAEARSAAAFADAESQWLCLTCRPNTRDAMAALLGTTGDALDELTAEGTAFVRLTGNEAHSLQEHLPRISDNTTAVAHVSIFDRGAHSGNLRLPDMPTLLHQFIEREIMPLARACLEHSRALILTTDHGLGFGRSGLTHGSGGVYETAIRRHTWGT